jgi:hypothetical protein
MVDRIIPLVFYVLASLAIIDWFGWLNLHA